MPGENVEMLLSLILCFLRWDHMVGFSHRPQEGWNRLFVISEQDGVDISIDGYSTGLQTPCLLYLHPSKQNVEVSLQARDRSVFHYSVSVVAKKTFLAAAID